MASVLKRARRGLETFGFSLLVHGARGLSPRRARALGAAVGRFAFDRARIRREVAVRNVIDHLRETDPERADAIARGSYEVIGRTFVGLLRGDRIPEEETRDLLTPEQADTFRRLYAEGNGVLLLSAHFGDWETVLLAVQRLGIPVAALAGDQANSSVDRSVRALRRRAGVKPLSARRGLRDALRFLRDGGCVATLGDQDARRRGIFIDFLGTPASTHTGVFSLARRTGAVVVFGVCVDRDDRRELRLSEPWRSDPEADEAEELRAGAVWYTRALEEEVRQAPDNYFWAHRRWKTSPPDAPPPDAPPPGDEA